jgi:hypothetical protein
MGWRKAQVRIIESTTTRSVDPPGEQHWMAGQKAVMIQWDRNPGLPPEDASWWTDFDIDGAHILKSKFVQVLGILEQHPGAE